MSQGSDTDEPLLAPRPLVQPAQAAATTGMAPLLMSAPHSSHNHHNHHHHDHYVSSSSTSSMTSGIGLSSADSLDQDTESGGRPIGLTGLQNLGNTCYMNAGIQALSNCPQLTGFMTDCASYVRKPGLSTSFQRLISDLWSPRRSPYVVPAGIAQGVKKVCPAFKGYSQHDAQEFLRCLLDQLHEELKVPVVQEEEDEEEDSRKEGEKIQEQEKEKRKTRGKVCHRHRCIRKLQPAHSNPNTPGHSHSHGLEDSENDMDLMISSDEEADDYETCDSGLSWDRSTSNGDHIMHPSAGTGAGTMCGAGTTAHHHHSLTHSHSHIIPPAASLSAVSESATLVSSRNGMSNNVLYNHSHQQLHQPQQLDHLPVIADPLISSSTSFPSLLTAGGGHAGNGATVTGFCDCEDAISRTVSLEPESGIYSMQSLSVNHGPDMVSTTTIPTAAATDADSIARCNGSMQSIGTQDLLSVDSSSSGAPVPNHHVPGLAHAKQQKIQSSSSPVDSTSSSKKNSSSNNNVKYRSVISDIFDGRILSSVQCLTCDNVSTTRETFQDLSLSIPTRDQLNFLRAQRMKSAASGAAGEMGSETSSSSSSTSSGRSSPDQMSVTSSSTSTAVQVSEAAMQSYSWIWSWIEWIFSMFWGPTVTLEDCLSAFFSADELKGDNMYSCQKCKKLRNGIKYSRVLDLPDILCIHLKRFRHELMYSSKISSQVTFPLEGLDMAPYVVTQMDQQQQENESNNSGETSTSARGGRQQQQSSPESQSLSGSQSASNTIITTYDLVSVICHHGTPASGHYTAYCLNSCTDTWYEFDDQYVTAVDPHQVAACEAYVLFYRKSSDDVNQQRLRIVQLIDRSQPSSSSSACDHEDQQHQGQNQQDCYFISNQWINRFNTFAEPGPISNRDFLCPHHRVPPALGSDVRDMCSAFSYEIWQYLVDHYGGGPECSRLDVCTICLDKEKAAAALTDKTMTATSVTTSTAMSHQVSASAVSLSSLLLNNSPFQ